VNGGGGVVNFFGTPYSCDWAGNENTRTATNRLAIIEKFNVLLLRLNNLFSHKELLYNYKKFNQYITRSF
jgi:hypothetical protein